MKERPIIFSAQMVRAILEGRKTQTRRIVKPHPRSDQIMPREWSTVMRGNQNAIYGDGGLGWTALDTDGNPHEFRCPYGQPGDRLWVREAWALIDKDYKPADLAQATAIVYRADGLKVPNQKDRDVRAIFADRCRLPLDAIKWRPSIHMPRNLSRIDLEIVAVRVERLKDISQSDAIAEGAPPIHPSIDRVSAGYGYPDFSRSWFAQLWEHINGPGSWEANHWVWVVEFKRVLYETPQQEESVARIEQLEAEIEAERNRRWQGNKESSDELRKAAKTEQELRAHVERMRGLLEWAKGFTIGGIEGEINEALAATPAPPRRHPGTASELTDVLGKLPDATLWMTRESKWRLSNGGNNKGAVPVHGNPSATAKVPLYTEEQMQAERERCFEIGRNASPASGEYPME